MKINNPIKLKSLCSPIALVGAGAFFLAASAQAADWTNDSVGGSAWVNGAILNITLEAGGASELNVTGDAISASGIITTGSGKLTLSGLGISLVDTLEGGAGSGKVEAGTGTSIVIENILTFASGGSIIGNVTTANAGKLNVTGGTLDLAAATNISALAITLGEFGIIALKGVSGTSDLSQVTGTGTIEISAVGTTADSSSALPPGGEWNGNSSSVKLSDAFAGTLSVKTGVVNVATFGGVNTIDLNGGGILFTGNNTFSKNITVGSDKGVIRLYAAANVTISGNVSGAGNTLTHTDGGNLTFSGNVELGTFRQVTGTTTFTGATALDTLEVGKGTVTFSGTATKNIGTVNGNGGTFAISKDSTVTAENIYVKNNAFGMTFAENSVLNADLIEFSHGATQKTISGTAGASPSQTINVGKINLRNGANVNSWGIKINVGAGGIVSSDNNYKFTAGSTIFGATANWSSTLNIEIGDKTNGARFDTHGNTITLTGNLSGVGKLVKREAGTLVLSGTNTYAGGTVISGGTIFAKSDNALGTGAVTVQSGGALQIANNVTLSGTGDVTLAEGAKLVIDLTGLTAEDSITLDILALGTKKLTVGGELITAENVDAAMKNGYYELLGGQWEDSEWKYVDGTLSLTLSGAIPEPSTFGLLAGLGALALVVSRRRRSRRN